MNRHRAVLLSLIFTLVLAVPALGQVYERSEAAFGGEVAGSESELAEKAAFIAQYDDGEVDAYFKVDDVGTHEFAMLFDGVGGPEVTLGGVDVCLRQTGSDPMIRYEVVVWAADGPGGTPGTELLTVAAVATGVTSTPTFDSTNLGYPLTTTDVYIGVRYNPLVDPAYWFCVDYDGIGGAVQPAYHSVNESGNWFTVQSGFSAPSYNAMMFRAFLSTPGVVAERLIVPGFEVDTTSFSGPTTLFAVRNLTNGSMSLDVEYHEQDGTLQRTDTFNLGPRETETVNVRDVPGLATDGAGIARGYIEIFGPGEPDLTPLFAGDYIQVDVGDDFAVGEQTIRSVDLCSRESIRFFDFGTGSRLTVWIESPQGASPGIDPVSFKVQVFDEAGNPVGGAQSVWTEKNSLELSAADFTAIDFGMLKFDFSNSGRGKVFGEYSADGRFSVGFDSQCENP